MKKVAQIVAGFCSRRNKSGYAVLCQVLEAALAAIPEERPLGLLCEEVGRMSGKKGGTIHKALARTTREIWENGDRQELERVIGYRLLEEPSPKELVMSLTQALWCGESRIEYHLLEGGVEQKVGVWARTGEDEYVVMPPFSCNREVVGQLVDQWNREQMPVQKFREMILVGELVGKSL